MIGSMINSLDTSQGTAELVANDGNSKSESGVLTFRARFVGQGYKQVTRNLYLLVLDGYIDSTASDA